MAFNPSPTGYFPNIQISTTGVFIPYTDFESYNINTSGDVRQLAYSFIDAFADQYLSLPSSDDQSDQVNITRIWSAQSDTVLRKVYTYSFDLAFSGVSVKS